MKGSLKRLIAIFMLFLHIVSLADGIVPDIDRSKNLNVDKAINGVPLVNIEAPNNNGISHNVYKDFNVDGRGAILNNSKDLTNSQLGGLIYGNPNLQNSKEASTIINEVSGVNRSRIEGYQEIAGKKANYILANPNGIYINGAGFINTGNVTLTTGSGNNLLNPEKGTIEVAGKGLDLRNINKSELIARVATLSAPIYGGEEVNLKLGSQGQSNKPEYALDARELGSIYAGRINIVVNEDGVGVKTEAPMYAEKGDVVISSKGKVYLKDTQAKGDIKISSTETEISEKLLAENGINIESGKTTNSGQIQANKDITINGDVDSSNLISTNKDISISGNLKNSGNISSTNLNTKDIENTNKIAVGEKLSSTKITSSGILSAKNISTIDVFNLGKLLANNINTKDLNNSGEISSENLTTTNLENSNKINVKENIKSDNIVNKTNNSEISSKNLTINNLDNKGNVKVVNNVSSQSITNNGKLLVENTVNSQNLINTATVQGKILDIKNEISSSGKILSDSITTKDISNSGNISSKVITTQQLTNSGEIISNDLSSTNIANSKGIYVNGKITTDKIVNSNTIESQELKANNITNSGKLLAVTKIEAQNLENKLSNSEVKTNSLNIANKIMSDGNIVSKDIITQNLVNNGSILSNNLTVEKDITNTNSIFANEKIIASNIFNSNKLIAKNAETNNLTNSGNITVKENLKTKDITNSNSIKVGGNLNTDNLKNSKDIEANNITIQKSLDNTNGEISSSNTTINASNIKNSNGNIQAVKNINITTANDLSLDGNYTANDTLNIKAKSFENNIDLKNDGKITFNLSGNLTNNKNISSTGNLDINAQKILNSKNDSAIGSMSNLSINVSLLENKGNLLFGEGTENKLKTAGNITNTGVIGSLGKLNIEANNILNDKHIASNNDLVINTNSITNKGLLYSTGNMKVDFKNNFLNDNAEIYSSENITITGKDGTFTNKVGDIESEKNISIVAKDIKNLAEISGSHKVIGSVSGNESNVDISKLDIKKYNKLSADIVNDFFKQYIIIPRLQKSGINIDNKRVEIKADEQRGSFFVLKKDDDGYYGAWDWEKDKSKAGVYLSSADKIESNYTSEMSTIKAGGNITLKATNDIENLESNILANGDVNITANQLINKNFDIAVKRKITLIRDIEYHGAAMHSLDWGKTYDHMGQKIYNHNEDKGNVIIEDEVTSYVGTGKNAKISAGGNIKIEANKVGNEILAKENVKVDSKNQNFDSTKVNKNDVSLDEINIDKNTNVDSITLNKKNLEIREEIDTKDYINLPKNDKGLFRINNNIDNKPGFSYLVETNINFIDKSRFFGSEYFFKRIGFNPDRNIRLLGDSFYETKLINKAILEGTGRRFLSGYKSDKEQMQALYDNAASEQEDLNLSLGIALSKDQIAKLKKDIIWYVEEEVQGQKVLVPKVYLTRNTLSKLKDKNASIDAGQELNITADNITNTGNLSANNITITSDNLTNKTILGANKASIDGNTVNIIAKNLVDNIGADIKAKENLTIKAKDISNLSTKRTNGYGLDTVTTGENLASIQAKNVTLNAKNNVQNTGAYIKADEKLDIKAKNVKVDTIEESRYYHDGDSNNYLTIDNKSNIGSNIEAKNIDITAKKDIDIKGSNIVAKEEANIKADGDINVVSATDSRYYAHKETNKGKFGKSSSEESVAYATRNVASNIIGDKVNITSEKDVSLLGSNVQANESGKIEARGNITQAGVKDINYHYEHTSKSRFGGLISKSTTSENYQENAIVSATVAGDKGLTYDSKNNLILSGVKVVSSGSIDLKGKDVEINPLETKSYSKFEEKKKGFSAKVSLKGANYSYGKDKFSDNSSTIIENSNEIVAGKRLTIEADNKVKAKAVNIYSNDNISISGNNGVEISSGKNIQEREIKQSSTRINTGIGIKSSIVNTVENVKNVDKLADFSGDSYDIVNKASNLVGAIRDGADAVNTILDPSYNGSQGAGTKNLSITDPKKYISVHSGVTRSKSEIKTYDESTNKSSITGKNIEINSKDKSVQIIGTDIAAKNLEISAKENIDISGASEEHRSSNSSSNSGLSVSATLDKAPLTITANISGAQGRSNGTYNTNSNIIVDEKFKTESGNLNISSSNIVADKVDIKAKNVVIESKQDKTESKNSSYGASVSVAVSPAGVELKNISVNGTKGKGKGSWTSAQTSVIAKNGGEITTDNFKDIGAIVGSENEKEKLKISAKTIEVKDLEDSNKYENVGGGISLGFEENKPQVPNISVVHDKIDKKQITRATAINTEIKVNNEIVKAEDLGFNTDISNSQETTKDKEKHLNAELHTDLFNKSERNKLIEAKKKIETVVENLGNSNRFKEGIAGVELDKFKNERQKEFNLINDTNISLEDKRRIVQDLYRDFLRSKGYKGDIPEVILTDEENSFSVDSKDKETGEKRKERIFISINNLNNKDFSKVFVHELAHMNTYDEGYLGEETSLYTRSKLEPDDKTKVFSEADKEKYLESLRTEYPKQKSLEEQYAEAKLVADKDREHFYDLVSDFIISSDYAGNDRVLLDDTSKEKLKKYGNNIYYDGYRVVGISKDGWAQLDFNDTLPNENEIVLIAGISRLISHPIKTISNIKNEIKLITNNGKEVIQEIGENDLKKLVDETPTIKLIDNTDKEIIKKVNNISIDAYSSNEIRNMSYENFKKLGKTGSGKNIRILDGNLDDAYQIFKSRAVKIEEPIKVPNKGIRITGYDKEGNKLLFRDFSSSGNDPTIDLFKGSNKNGEMKFIEGVKNGSKK